MRFLGIDYGQKRIGIAISDEKKQLAFPYRVIEYSDKEAVLKDFTKIVKSEKITRFVIGLPLNFKGEETPEAKSVRNFARSLEELTKVPVSFENEIFTTKIAKYYSEESVDAASAALILQGYIDRVLSPERLE
jgi:putative Holliday junction resolvase